MIVRGARELMDRYHELGPGDVFVGPLGLSHLKESIFVDLLERGVRCYPSALSQILYRSKTAQAIFLNQWMLPHTRVVSRRIELMDAIGDYSRHKISQVVTKQNRLHCGHGVCLWNSMEMLYSHVGLKEDAYPFVLQPFLKDFIDIRVIVAGDYVEAYTRDNPYNFRKNLSSGGSSVPYRLDDKQVALCRDIMKRGKFPYAHIDLHVTEDHRVYLSEIALNGGLKGASINRPDLDGKKEQILEEKIRAES